MHAIRTSTNENCFTTGSPCVLVVLGIRCVGYYNARIRTQHYLEGINENGIQYLP